ncbi:hypothetical protein TIFTF001_031462 [Ficus carica]|uniref:Uncharacterized protein n=1 Tax=Ficus carica TaxID=3494 RepID=A0AA88DWZ4_FICCA|nr:hypothetical protein TIFTF001_031462 [Ficus carica]
MGNSQPTRSHVPAPAPIPAHVHRPAQGQYLYPQANMGCESPPQKKKHDAVIDCNKAAEMYGGYVITEHGGNNYPRKPQAWARYRNLG